jgi:hypothetical protein
MVGLLAACLELATLSLLLRSEQSASESTTTPGSCASRRLQVPAC